ncbi:MAG: hypothetical protein U5K43_08065 [Halofilum sp. (in: g-proteobacteria)]|nr:hypothetical protein [Halofilum sp. (in: g-proteobacteria)]
MTGCAHHMPFGTECLDDGRVRFRLWAPQAERVTLRIEDIPSPLELDMAAETGGWFGIVTSYGAPGSRYRYRIDGGPPLPDPASRFQPDDVHGASEVIDPKAYQWADIDWIGRPWREAVLYELHVGTFTPEGSFAAAKQRLGHLADLGVTAIELMPVADVRRRAQLGLRRRAPATPSSTRLRPDLRTSRRSSTPPTHAA